MTDPNAAAPLRILHMASSQRWTGVAEPAARLARVQQLHGHHVGFACIAGSSFERRLGERGIPFVPGFSFDRHVNFASLRRDIRHLRECIARDQYDIIHCHLPHDHWIAALALRRPFARAGGRQRPAIVRTVHRQRALRTDIPHRWLVGKGADMTITVSESARRMLTEEVGLPSVRSAWVRGAVDLERFRPGLNPMPIRQQYGIGPEARVAGLVARMQPYRGHMELIDVVSDVALAVPQSMIVLAGRGELKNRILRRIENHPHSAHLRRMGYHRDDLEYLYAALDVAVLMVPGSDGSCRAMLEAMACGRPVIGAATGAMLDDIRPGETGWLFEPGDRAGLKAALIDALSHPERLREMGLAARRHVEQYHSPERQYEETMEVYRQALERRSRLG